jgi:hypothetical protein
LEQIPPEPEDDLPPPVSEEEWLASSENADAQKPLERPPTPSWMLLVTPFGGFSHNQTRVKYLIPQSPEQGVVSYLDRTYKDQAGSWGAGGMAILRAHAFTFTDVFTALPKVGNTSMIGNIAMVNAVIPTSVPLQPFLGGGLAFSDIRITRDSHIDRETQTHKATITDFDLHVQSLMPLAEIGMRFNLPLQHWSITPVYQYSYETIMSHATASGLGLEVTSDSGQDPQSLYWPGFASTKKQWFESHSVGAKFFFDFYHFLQFSGELLWNLSQKSLVAKTNINVMFSKYMGLAALFEHAELINTTNTSIMVGPTFAFTPRSYFSELEEYKRQKNQQPSPQPPPAQP